MTLIRHWTSSKTGGEECLCPECGWFGEVRDCAPQIDDLALCPECGHWVEYRDPPEDNTVRKSK